MQNLISIIAANPKAINIPKNANMAENTDPKENPKDFVAILFDQIKDSVKISLTDGNKLSSKVKVDLDSLLKNDKKKSPDELLLNEVLSILSTLKNGNDRVSFPKFSDKLAKVLSDKSTLNEFKGIKNIDDLLKLSKKYNLGLEKITFTKEKIETLQVKFPKLDIKSFFDDKTAKETKTANLDKKSIKSKKTIVIEKLISDLSKKIDETKENPKNILQTLLKNIDEDSKKVIIKTTQEDKKDKVTQFIKNDEKRSIKIDTKDAEKPKIIVKNIEENSEKNINAKDSVTKNIKNKITSKEDVSIVEKNIKVDKKTTSKKDNKSTTRVEQANLFKDMKQAGLQVKQKARDISLNNIQTTKNNSLDNLQTASTKTDSTDDLKKDAKESNTLHKVETKTIEKAQTFKTDKNSNTRQSLNQFANDLKEKIENYKPPIMKLQMTLTPKNLGEVEVTLLNRGNNLHVNITSNTNTMALFTQNQAEFKNSLVNMGFTNLEMSFSDQGKNNQQNQNNQQKSANLFEEAQNSEDFSSTVELIVPKYV